VFERRGGSGQSGAWVPRRRVHWTGGCYRSDAVAGVFRDWNEPALLDLEGNTTPIHLDHPQTSFMRLSPDGKQLL